ncbi:MAG: VOC family protein [Candidatus Competibacter sp.]|nr:VOC family protein [Candidatus Competibacter sp.]
MHIDRLDHFVLTVRDIDVTIRFYQTVLGMAPVTFGAGRRALAFGQSKINLHPADAPIVPHANHPMPGSADLCFIASEPIKTVIDHLRECGVPIEEGPVPRTGALGPITSVYLRDPDGNLLEVSAYQHP